MRALPLGVYTLSPRLVIQAVDDEARLLHPGSASRRAILSDRPHVYQISLSAGQYLHIEIGQEQPDLAVTLLDPALKVGASRQGFLSRTVPLSFIAQNSGVHFLKLELLPGSKAFEYELRIEPVRSANARDRIVVASENEVSEGHRLCTEWKATSVLEAIERYERASRYSLRIGDQSSEASAFKQIGEAYASLSRNREAVRYFNRALSSGSEASPQVAVDSLNGLCEVYLDLGDTKKALEYCDRALHLSRTAGYRQGEAQALNNSALVRYSRSDLDKALDQFDQALALWDEINDRRGRAETLTNIGYTYSDLGDITKAQSHFEEALAFWRLVRNQRGEALVLTALGLEYTWLGEMQKALNIHKEAYQILRNLGDSRGQAVTLNGIGHAYDVLGERDKALGFFKRALPLQRASGRRYGEAITLGHIGKLYYSSGDFLRALVFFKRKLALVRSLGDPRATAYTSKDIGAVLNSLNKRYQALAYYRRALSLSRAGKDPRGQAYSLTRIGYVYYQSGEKQKALTLYLQALALLQQAEDQGGIISTSYNIARVKRDLGDLGGALSDIRALLEKIEALRTKVDSEDLRSSYFASVQQCYKLGIELLMSMHWQDPTAGLDAAAFEMSERSRARSLLDTLGEARLDLRDEADASLLQRERDLQKLLNAEVAMLSTGAKSLHLSRLKEQISELTKEYEEVRARIRATNPRYAALMQPRTLTLSETQQQVIDRGSVLLEYSLGDERSYLWAVTSSSISSFVLPSRAEIEKQSRRVFDLLTSYKNVSQTFPGGYSAKYDKVDREYWSEAARLSQMLLGPAASQLKDKRLLIVPEGALHYIPFSALPAPDIVARVGDKEPGPTEVEPLFLKHEIVSLPSASTVAALREPIIRVGSLSRAIAVFADPVFEKDDARIETTRSANRGREFIGDQDSENDLDRVVQRLRSAAGRERFPRLLASKREAETILTFAMKERSLVATGFKANLSMLQGIDMSQYRVVHFATHGVFETEHPELSAIVLSLVDDQGRPQNGLLRLREIYNLRMPVDLVVLSACETALGKNVGGEGLVGLTRGFMYAGAAQVISSLWKVDDDATSEFMKHFYRRMFVDGERPVAALASAEAAMWRQKRWRSPYYWAAFVFQGKWE